jgi:tRNA (cmo5U34)-methyltransferase
MTNGPGPEHGRSTAAIAWWRERVAHYDEFIRRVVPDYDGMIERLLDALPPARRVLELGCGTGTLSLRLARRDATADFTFVDASAEMLAMTRARLEAAHADIARRARFIEAYFETMPIEADSADLIVSSLAIHHVEDKAALFRRLRVVLAPGGSLRFVDGLAGASPFDHARIWASYVGHWNGRCTEDEIRELLVHSRQHDHYITLREHFALLEAAGFEACDCIWRDGLWTLVTAEAPARA